jgi:ABC-type sugar transport system permease subunit
VSVAPALGARRSRPRGPQWLWGLAYAAPAVTLVSLFVAYPFASILYHAFTRWDGITPGSWVGLHNFRLLVHDPIFLRALRNNALFAISVPIQVVFPLLVAYAIHLRIPGWRLFRATVFLPAVYATVVIGILVSTSLQLDGPLNSALGGLGLGSFKHEWLGSANTSIPVILLVVVWTNFGRVLEIVLVVNTITAFAFMFTYIYTITNGGPGYDTYVSEYYIWNQAFTNQNMGYASAIGLTLVGLVLGIGFLQIRLLTREQS